MEKRERQFDYLKAIGIILVIIMHIWQLGYEDGSIIEIIFAFFFSMIIPMFMIISGYFYTASWEKQGLSKIRSYFSMQNMSRKILRILIPFVVVYILQIIYVLTVLKWEWFDFKQVIYWGLQGGFGPGSYYTPILIQIILLFPFLYFLFKMHHFWGSIAILTIQLILEWSGIYFNISNELYRLLAYRYIVFLLAGMIFYHYRTEINKIYLLLAAVLGLIYVYYGNYKGMAISLFPYWGDCSMPTVLFFFPATVGMYTIVKKIPQKLDRLIRSIGTATFSIYLVQMFYYSTQINERIPGIVLQIVVNCSVCISIGLVLHYYICQPLIKKCLRILK